MPLRRTLFVTILFIAVISSRADTFTFQFSGYMNAGSGTLVAAGTGNAGEYLVTGITGTMNGLAITSLLTPGTYPPDAPNDNSFFFPVDAVTAYFDECGVSFELSDGTDVNLYYGTYSSGAGLLGPGYILIQGTAEASSALTSLSISAASAVTATTPEPSTLTLLATGMLVLGLMVQDRLPLRPPQAP